MMTPHRDELDHLCDDFALAGMMGTQVAWLIRWPSNPFLRWVAELGLREGQHCRRAAGMAA